MSRVAGADESYMLAEQYFGLSAPIQYTWVYPSDPGSEALVRLRDQLAAGGLNRRVHRVRMPIARHRWVLADHTPDIEIEAEPIRDDAVAEWADGRLRSCGLDPIGGQGWRLGGAHTESGKFVVSLLVSHMIADGQALYNALAKAHAGTSSTSIPHADRATGMTGLREDLADAGSQVVGAAGALRIIAGELWRGRNAKKSAAPAPKASGPVAPQLKPIPDGDAPDTTLAILDVDKDEWLSTAKEHGGTANGLLIGVMGGVVQRAGVPLRDEGMRVCIAVNRREDGDESANASGGVWIRLRDRISPAEGLTEIRKLSKQALIDYSASGNAKMADNLQTVVRLLPKRIVGKMMKSVPGPDATVSNLGVAPNTAIELGTQTAESFAIRAIMQGHSPADRRRQGPAVAAWAVEYGDKVTLTVFGIHPEYFGDTEVLRKNLRAEFETWGMTPRIW